MRVGINFHPCLAFGLVYRTMLIFSLDISIMNLVFVAIVNISGLLRGYFAILPELLSLDYFLDLSSEVIEFL